MALKGFLLSKTFRNHFLAALGLTILLLWLSMQILSLYTHRGESLVLPDFSGMTMSQARQVAKKMSLRFEVEDSVYRAGRRAGTILMQNPGAGHKIKSGRMIYLTLASSIPGQEEVPKLTDISLRQARVLLESKGFIVGNIEYKESEFSDLVLEQKNNGVPILPGSRLNSGSAIDLVVGGNGVSSETTVPDFTGMTLAEALELFNAKQLMTGSILFDESVTNKSDSMSARIVNQYPPADSTVNIPAGSAINLFLSTKPKE